MKKTVLSFLFLLPLLLLGQDNFQKDTTFFNTQLDKYSKWLEKEGLNGYIKVLDYKLLSQNKKKFTHFSLRLKMTPPEKDSALSIWKGLRNEYTKNELVEIEEVLFDKMIYLMEIPEDNASIQILDSEGGFRFKVFTENGRLMIKENINKSIEPDPIYLSYTQTGKLSKAQFDAKYTKEFVLDKAFQFAVKRYQITKPGCQGRKPVVNRLRSSENQLRFEVMDLCVEVLTDASENPLCSFYQLLGGDCNWKTREWLTCVFTYIPNPATGGFSLALRIDGKVGSGYYDTLPRGAYHDMETDYKRYLEAYADKIMAELEVYLKKQ